MPRTTPVRRPRRSAAIFLMLALFVAACGDPDQVTIKRTEHGNQGVSADQGLAQSGASGADTDAASGETPVQDASGGQTVTSEVIVVDPGAPGQPAKPGGQPAAQPSSGPAVAVDRNSDRGVTTDSIKVGVISPISGGTRFVGEPPYRMTLSYAEDVNRNGGINGRMIEVIGYDVCSTCPEDALAAAIKAVEEDKVFAIMNSYVSAPAMGPAQDYLSEHQTPQIQVDNKPVPDQWSYSIGLNLAHRGAINADAVNAFFEDNNLPKKVALLRFNVPFDEEVQKWQKIGLSKYPDIEIVADESVEFGSATMAEQRSQTSRMQRAGAELVLCSMGLVCGFNVSNADQIGWNVPYFSTIMYDQFAIDVAGDGIDNHIVMADSDGLAVVSMKNEAMDRFNRIRNTYYRDADIGVLTLYAALGFTILEDGLKSMGDNVTRVGMRDFMSQMQGYNAGGFVKDITVIPGENHNGVKAAALLRLNKDRQWDMTSNGFIEPDPRHGLP